MNIFARAAEVLMEKGHCKGVLEDDTGAVCAMGALRTAYLEELEQGEGSLYPDWYQASDIAVRRLGTDIPGDRTLAPLARWNDAKERTVEDVVRLFRELAAEEES